MSRGRLFAAVAAGAAVALVAIIAFGGAPATASPSAVASPSGHLTMGGARCAFAVTMTPSSYIVPLGGPVTIHTALHVQFVSAPGCTRTAAYYYSGLPLGLLPANSPFIGGYTYVPGIYHVSVVVVVPNGLAIGHLTMTVAGGH